MTDFAENECIKFWIEDNILYGMYKKDCILGIQNIKEIVKLRLEFQCGKSYKGISYLSKVGTITPEARHYLAKEGYEGLEMLAIVATSLPTILIGNLYITFNKPVKPTRLFKSTEDALKWLHGKE